VVAEGVETQDIAQALASMSCDEAQGYLYCKPIPVSDFLAWVLQWQAKREVAALAEPAQEPVQA